MSLLPVLEDDDITVSQSVGPVAVVLEEKIDLQDLHDQPIAFAHIF